jgi:hypothetical protein
MCRTPTCEYSATTGSSRRLAADAFSRPPPDPLGGPQQKQTWRRQQSEAPIVGCFGLLNTYYGLELEPDSL